MADSDKPDTQALILKQLKSIKVALWAVVVLIVLFTGGGVIGGGVIAGIVAFGVGEDASEEKEGYSTKRVSSTSKRDFITGKIPAPWRASWWERTMNFQNHCLGRRARSCFRSAAACSG